MGYLLAASDYRLRHKILSAIDNHYRNTYDTDPDDKRGISVAALCTKFRMNGEEMDGVLHTLQERGHVRIERMGFVWLINEPAGQIARSNGLWLREGLRARHEAWSIPMTVIPIGISIAALWLAWTQKDEAEVLREELNRLRGTVEQVAREGQEGTRAMQEVSRGVDESLAKGRAEIQAVTDSLAGRLDTLEKAARKEKMAVRK